MLFMTKKQFDRHHRRNLNRREFSFTVLFIPCTAFHVKSSRSNYSSWDDYHTIYLYIHDQIGIYHVHSFVSYRKHRNWMFQLTFFGFLITVLFIFTRAHFNFLSSQDVFSKKTRSENQNENHAELEFVFQ